VCIHIYVYVFACFYVYKLISIYQFRSWPPASRPTATSRNTSLVSSYVYIYMYICLHVYMCIYRYRYMDVERDHLRLTRWQCLIIHHVLQSVAVCCSVLQCVAVCCSVLQCVAVCCSVSHNTSLEHHINLFLVCTNASCHTYKSWQAYKSRHINTHQDTSTHPRQITVDMTLFHVCMYWVSHVTRKNESCHTYKWLMSRIKTSHVTPRAQINTPFIHRNRHTWMHLRQIRVHIALSCICTLDESCHALERNAWHSKSMDESCQRYEWVTSHNIHTPTHLSYTWINARQSFMSLSI